MGQRSSSRIDSDSLVMFATLVRAGGVRGAAKVLAIPRSTVSRKLAELETAVGTALVARTARRFTVTELGRQLAARGEQLESVMRDTYDLVRDAAVEPSGTLRVAVAPVLGEEILPAIVAELVATHPRLSIDAQLSTSYADLRRAGIDVALRAASLEDATDLYAQRLGESVSGYWISPDYAARHGIPKTPAQLVEHACIVMGPPPNRWSFARGAAPISVVGRVRLDNFRVARDAAAQGVGVLRTAVVFARPLVQRGELVPILERWWPSVPIYAVHAGPTPSSPGVRAFIAAAKLAVARVLPGDRPAPRWRSA